MNIFEKFSKIQKIAAFNFQEFKFYDYKLSNDLLVNLTYGDTLGHHYTNIDMSGKVEINFESHFKTHSVGEKKFYDINMIEMEVYSNPAEIGDSQFFVIRNNREFEESLRKSQISVEYFHEILDELLIMLI